MNFKQKNIRQTKVQFYYEQAQERRKRYSIKNVKAYQLFQSPQKSSRIIRKNKLDISSTKLGNSSCCCSECGKESVFKQRIFKIYTFTETQHSKKEYLRQQQIMDRYRNSKYIKVFKKLVYCLLFIIRYKIVQNIRYRQRQRMKKAFKTRIDNPRMTLLNVLEIASKQFRVSPKFKSATNFDYVFSQNATAVNSPQDSDEEFYHLKPRKSLVQKFSSDEQYIHKKLSKSQQKLYLITGLNSVLNQYVTKKLNSTQQKSINQQQQKIQPPLLSKHTSPRQNQSTHLPNIRLKQIN
ncbi:unnamed protein product (macronuclear) [Paramecium tetraurelia]|uniref:Transmembrane protein n=1 Tax=Paramecium tetraurelia TaxID=5888 RepID=A0CMK8_PARTE|nr:uncharacterized protein GSPATT00008504001 [Paramecium tetraurelia]CAK72025.1 unnamed protein product [Paramecium tetraurelia]|eukprot:XP_001439422.1 hypothetical protein (macronuclear) [Paramecium tetraurelia strain d4-2]